MLLDVSPPPLYALIVQGSLIFDDSDATGDLTLDASYVIVNGGTFQVIGRGMTVIQPELTLLLLRRLEPKTRPSRITRSSLFTAS